MKRVLSAFALTLSSLLFAGSAMAGAPSLSFNGSGCPVDEDAVNYHWEGSVLVINFAGMTASKGPGVSLIEARKNCSVTMNLNVPDGLTYTLVSFGATGYESLGEGDNRNLSVTSFFQGSADQHAFVREAEGPKDANFRTSGFGASSDLVWSPCNAQRAHTINAAVRVSGTDRQQAAFATVDSLRVRFRLGLCQPQDSAPGDNDSILIEPSAG